MKASPLTIIKKQHPYITVKVKLVAENNDDKKLLNRILDDDKTDNERELIEDYIHNAVKPYQAVEILSENEYGEFVVKVTNV